MHYMSATPESIPRRTYSATRGHDSEIDPTVAMKVLNRSLIPFSRYLVVVTDSITPNEICHLQRDLRGLGF